MLEVSVAWVRLQIMSVQRSNDPWAMTVLLRVEIKMCSVHLVEPPQEIFGRSVDIVTSGIVWKVIPKRRPTELLLEQIDLVQEEDDACPHKPSRIDHRVEKHETFHHAILEWRQLEPLMDHEECHLVAFFQKYLIILAERHAEYNGCDILETMDPLLPFAPLAAYIEHAAGTRLANHCCASPVWDVLYAQLTHRKPCLVNSRCLGSRSEHVCFGWDIVRGGNSRCFIEETVGLSVDATCVNASTSRAY